MDFLDQKKQKAHAVRMLIGYVVVGVALVITTVILLYQAYGFGIGRNGQVIQNGLVFVSSQPGPASIYVNGKLKGQTNTRLVLPAGQYTFTLQRDGYHTWRRAVSVDGGSVEHFDYPLLVPLKLSSSTIKRYDVAPDVVSQSPDQRWLLVSLPQATAKFDLYDLNNIKDGAKPLALPASLLTASTNPAVDTMQAVAWSADNRHVLLTHTYQETAQTLKEYILLDRQDPAQSLNLTTALALGQTEELSLHNQAYDQYYEYDAAAQTLKTASLKAPSAAALLDHVAAFKSYGSNIVLYADDTPNSQNQVVFKLRQGDNAYVLHTVAAGSQYLLELARYSGDWYVAVGAGAENKVYVYKNPASVLSDPKGVLVPAAVLKLTTPNYVAFSANAQFIMAENGTAFAVYDAENQKSYAYHTEQPLDEPQAHAAWMDGDRLRYVSGGKAAVVDFDSTNMQTLGPASPAYPIAFDQQYKAAYTITSQASVQSSGNSPQTAYDLTSTSLLAAADK